MAKRKVLKRIVLGEGWNLTWHSLWPGWNHAWDEPPAHAVGICPKKGIVHNEIDMLDQCRKIPEYGRVRLVVEIIPEQK